jgi:hypothetical protein
VVTMTLRGPFRRAARRWNGFRAASYWDRRWTHTAWTTPHLRRGGSPPS